ncbi:acylneuraminate cytidylyltransferase family protein [Methylophilaceae bacterium]|nr:acylneuraminate cytidylyltransferase family protein [Methylophilaceae bacterium]|tara:strand:- start:7278 stop:7991 length:714 start_codon:yes stop_codon:yes gene_type:complete
MSIVAFIFARGGSKGLPDKNIKIFNGKPLIAWSIEQAKTVNRVDKVIVSTDSEVIAKIAREYGAETPFIRPAELATDNSPEWLSWQHALKYLQNSNDGLPDLILSIPPTSPLRDFSDLDKIIDEYQKGNADIVISVTESNRSPFFNIVREGVEGYINLFASVKEEISRRQDCPKTYDITTIGYAAKPSFILNNKSIFEGRVRQVIFPKERSIDIDTLLDFEIAEYISKKNGSKIAKK